MKHEGERITFPISGSDDFVCEIHGLTVVERVRKIKRDDGTERYGGSYLACPSYVPFGDGGCGFYVSTDKMRRAWRPSDG